MLRSGFKGAALAVAVAAAALPAPLRAAGLELPERGPAALARGGAAVAGIADATAVDLNPGALSRLHGGHVLYSHELLFSHARFTRAASSLPQDANVEPVGEPYAQVENAAALFPLGVTLAATHDFGLRDLVFAVSLYGPHGSASADWPVSGGQRFMLTGYDGVILYPGVSIAYGQADFGVGATLQAATMPTLTYRLVVDGIKAGPLNPLASSAEVEARVTGSDPFAPTAIVGAWWRPLPALELAASGRAVPIFFHGQGDLTIANVPNQSSFTPEQLHLTDAKARFDLTLPPTARLGVRYRDVSGETERFDIELDAVYEAWSVFDRLALDLSGQVNLYGGEPLPDVHLEKRWRDTLSLRLGGAYAVVPGRLVARAGGFVEQGAVPARYEDVDFPSFGRLGLAAGLGVELGPVTLAAAYAHVFQETRTVSERAGKVFQQRPLAQCPDACGGRSAVPANAGRFETGYDQLALSVDYAY